MCLSLRICTWGSVHVCDSHPMPSTCCQALAPGRAALCLPMMFSLCSAQELPRGPPVCLRSRLCAPLLLLIWGLHKPLEGWPSPLGPCSLGIRTYFLPRDFVLERSQPRAFCAVLVRRDRGSAALIQPWKSTQGQVQPDCLWEMGGRGAVVPLAHSPFAFCASQHLPNPLQPAILSGWLGRHKELSRCEGTPTLAGDLGPGCPRH